MVAEFRALRASILRLWSEAQNEGRDSTFRGTIDEVTRFNEAIDQVLAESIARYSQDVDHAKDLFLGVVGHDLRNPLNAIMMSATIMMTDEGPEWTHTRKASRIIDCGTRMERIISDLMDVTRARLEGGIPIVRANVDLEPLCRHAVEEISALHPDRVVSFEADGPSTGAWDGGRIGQLVSNLMGNAQQHGAEGTPIEVGLRGQPEEVVLTVHNRGTPIPKGDLEQIFNPFRQLDAAKGKHRPKGSVGLGLFIAQAIVRAHEGKIEVRSTKLGTTFTVRLPRRVQAPQR